MARNSTDAPGFQHPAGRVGALGPCHRAVLYQHPVPVQLLLVLMVFDVQRFQVEQFLQAQRPQRGHFGVLPDVADQPVFVVPF